MDEGTPHHSEAITADRDRINIPLFFDRYASVLSTQRDTPLPVTPVYALNWFNTRWLPLYNLYNLLAEKPLRAAGGRGYFKARLAEHLHGSPQLQRDVLLIVRYPSIAAFGGLLRSRFFQLVSILRMLSVRDFTFAFTTRIDQPDLTVESDVAPYMADAANYLIHIHRGVDCTESIHRLVGASQTVSVLFSGRVCGHLATGSGAGQCRDSLQRIPCVMDRLVVLGAPAREHLTGLVSTAAYRQIVDQSDDPYVAVFDRLM